MKQMRKHRQQEKGQALVEFALTLPVLLLILSGVLDLGRAYYAFIAIEEAVAEAALYYAIFPECPSETDYTGGAIAGCENPNNAIYRAQNSGSGEFDTTLVEWNIPAPATEAEALTDTAYSSQWDYPLPNGCASIGCSVLIQVEYPFELLTPGLRLVNGGSTTLTLRTQAAQIIVYDAP